jgi:transposase
VTNALRFILTGGERNDITQAEAVVAGFHAEYAIADKGRDAAAFIHSRANHKVQRETDARLYKERHLVEKRIRKLKHLRRGFSRFDKLAKNYLRFIYFAGTVIWPR